MDDQMLERVARNEVAFRHVNERLRTRTTAAAADQAFPFTCECGWLGCNKLVELSLTDYEAVRAHPRRFFVLEGHVVEEAEVVVERHGTWVTVEKLAEEGRIAEQTDPRANEHPG